MHTDGKYRFEDEETVHQVLEADVRLHLNDLQITTSRRKRISDPNAFFTAQIYEINNFYDDIIDHYYLRPGKVKPDRWEKSASILEECLSLAVMNVANVYLGFEEISRIFLDQKKYAETIQKVISNTSHLKNYYLTCYPTGTLSLRVKCYK
jgi:hypothetical protein